MNEIKIRLIKDGAFEINEELAGLVPMASEAEQVALMNDIAENQQQDPIVLWRGKVIDGRCRQKALTTLGYHIMYRELDSALTEDEVRIFVKSVNTRRNLTHTQKVISATRESLRPGSKSIPLISKAWGIGRGILENGRYIARHKPEFIEPLFNGLSVRILNSEGKETDSNKVSTIYASIKREMELTIENEDHAWSDSAIIKTQKGKEWYYGFIKSNNITDIQVKMALVELANFKYQLAKK